MKNVYKKIIGVNIVVIGLIMSRFFYPELTNVQISINQFVEILKPLGFDAAFFRISSAFSIVIALIYYLLHGFYFLHQNKVKLINELNVMKTSLVANILGVIISCYQLQKPLYFKAVFSI